MTFDIDGLTYRIHPDHCYSHEDGKYDECDFQEFLQLSSEHDSPQAPFFE